MRPNYRGDLVPAAGGTGVVLALLGSAPLVFAVGAPGDAAPAATALCAIAGMGFLGLLDDLGGAGPRGFAGHLRALLAERRAGTGVLRAAWGVAVALSCAIVARRPLLDLALAALAAALSFNLVNLFDTRPGRAAKTFFFAAAVLWIARLAVAGGPAGAAARSAWAAGPLVAAWAASALAPLLAGDLGGRAMLGNVGSSALGAALGVALAWTGGRWLLSCALLALLALHAYAERRSLGAAIERAPLLRWLDALGRGGPTGRGPRPVCEKPPPAGCPSRKGVCRRGGE